MKAWIISHLLLFYPLSYVQATEEVPVGTTFTYSDEFFKKVSELSKSCLKDMSRIEENGEYTNQTTLELYFVNGEMKCDVPMFRSYCSMTLYNPEYIDSKNHKSTVLTENAHTNTWYFFTKKYSLNFQWAQGTLHCYSVTPVTNVGPADLQKILGSYITFSADGSLGPTKNVDDSFRGEGRDKDRHPSKSPKARASAIKI